MQFKHFVIFAVIRQSVQRVISASLRLSNTASFEEMWQAVSNAVFDKTNPRFEPQTSRFRDERVTARPPWPVRW